MDQAGIELTTSRLRQLRQLPVVQHVRFTPLKSRQKRNSNDVPVAALDNWQPVWNAHGVNAYAIGNVLEKNLPLYKTNNYLWIEELRLFVQTQQSHDILYLEETSCVSCNIGVKLVEYLDSNEIITNWNDNQVSRPIILPRYHMVKQHQSIADRVRVFVKWSAQWALYKHRAKRNCAGVSVLWPTVVEPVNPIPVICISGVLQGPIFKLILCIPETSQTITGGMKYTIMLISHGHSCCFIRGSFQDHTRRLNGKVLQRREASIIVLWIVASLCNSTGVSATMLPMYLQNFKAIRPLYNSI